MTTTADVTSGREAMRGVGKRAAGRGGLGIISRQRPAAGRGEVVIEVIAAGICGTDLHIVDDEFPSVPPVIMGHEVAGVVRELGDGVDDGWRGIRVAIETYRSTCGSCGWCRSGRRNLCAQRRSFGSHVDGGFAPYLSVPIENLWALPDHVSDAAGALLEPLACVAHCLCDPNLISPGDEVLVTGPGTMGLLAGQVARASGGRVTVVGTTADTTRLAVATRLGLGAVEASASIVGPFDVVVECSGHAGGARTCIDAVRPGGRYVQVGLFGREIPFALDQVCYREVQLSSGFASTPQSWARAVGLVGDRRVDLEPLVTEVAPLAAWERVFDATRRGAGVKFVFDPRSGDLPG
jgi:L-iditol 2-dehydrogenase